MPLLLFHMCLSLKMPKYFHIFTSSPHSCFFSLYGMLHTFCPEVVENKAVLTGTPLFKAEKSSSPFPADNPENQQLLSVFPSSFQWLSFPSTFQLCKNSIYSTLIKRKTLKLYMAKCTSHDFTLGFSVGCRYLKSKLHVELWFLKPNLNTHELAFKNWKCEYPSSQTRYFTVYDR